MTDSTSAPQSTRPPALKFMRAFGMELDPWQIQVLETAHQRILLNCCRQAGKSTVVAVLSLVDSSFFPGALILLLSRNY